MRAVKPRELGTVEEMLTRLYDAAGGVKRVTHLLGQKSSTRVYAFTDPDADAEISFSAVHKITAFTHAPQAAQMMAHAAGGYFTPALPAHAPDDISNMINALVKEGGDVVQTLVTALSPASSQPGDLTPEEARYAKKEIEELIAVCGIALSIVERRIDQDGEGHA